MKTVAYAELLTGYEKIRAEKKSYEAILLEYDFKITSRDNEIDILHKMLAEANEYRNSMDSQAFELSIVQNGLNDLHQHVSNTDCMVNGRQQPTGGLISSEQQIEILKTSFTYLHLQLADFQAQLQDLDSRNLLLLQQTIRIAELESLLENQ